MTAPNLLAITQITGKTTPFSIESLSTTALANAVGSGQVVKINSLFICNIDGVNAADINVKLKRALLEWPLASTVSVSADNTLIVIGKETPIYLEEGDSIVCSASSSGVLSGIISYEVIG